MPPYGILFLISLAKEVLGHRGWESAENIEGFVIVPGKTHLSTTSSSESSSNHRRGEFLPKTAQEQTWTALRPPARALGPPKLALLMMVNDSVPLSHVWLSWFDTVGTALKPAVFLHAHGISQKNDFGTPSFAPYLVWPPVPSTWKKTFDVELELMGLALADPNVTHVATVCEKSVPLKPVSFIYSELLREPATRMCPSSAAIKRAETWWLMSREDAELFMSQKDLVSASFQPTNKVDGELSFLYPLRLRSTRWGEMSPLKMHCVMFADWSDKFSQGFGDGRSACDCPSLLTANYTRSTKAHPRSFSVGSKLWSELRSSPFWFGRKVVQFDVPADTLWRDDV
eukprot:TRINITY_DN3874_c0_g1_i12.p1 TRINITY_DN3874_c0_g1~~TRINITY_DN3874_c0_g1_i12.p1  ORF type:complete len:342 (+),score=21.47 TRINITY_DN3874_c0_g1_i12:71-1096(+)